MREVTQSELSASMHGQAANVLVVEIDLAVLAARESDNHVKSGGLAGAIRPQEAHDLAALDLER